MVSVDDARKRSEEEWLRDLAQLRSHAKERFGDVAWVAEGSQRVVFAHKCIVYARATGNWQQRFMGVPHSLGESGTSVYGHSTTSLRTWTPHSQIRRDSVTPTASSSSPAPSDLSHSSSSSVRPIILGTTDLDVFETSLEYFYTGGREAEAFAVVLEGFNEGGAAMEDELTGTAKLRQDLHFCWRSKLFADVDIVLESSDGTLSTPFSAHRAILASRCPYFKTLLSGDFADSQLDRFTLPSPPFSPASLVFVLGYMYSGTLDFSNRTFNLDTVFETWRCAAFLSMSTLQDELEGRIVAMVTPQRAPRIYQFAHSPDVNNSLLAKTALPFVVDHFDDMWATPYIGTLDYDPQMELVTKVRSLISPVTVAKFSRQTRKLRKKVELDKSGWARNVESMLDAVEKKLVSVIANRLPEIVASPGFIDLVDGVGFSSDVLEWLLLQVFNKDELQEKNAPMAYQALVGSVLLREEGIMIDARMHVEDTRNGLLKYINSRWGIIRDGGGFDSLEPWCLKELADELEITTKELLAGERINQNRRCPPKRLVEKSATPRSRPSLPSTSAVTLPPAPRQSLPTRTARLSTTSTASRSSIDSTVSRASTAVQSVGAAARPPSTRTPVIPASRTPLASTTPRPTPRPNPIPTSQAVAPSSTAPSVRARLRTTSAVSTSTSTSRRPLSPARSIASTVRSVATQRPLPTPRSTPIRSLPNGAPTVRSTSTIRPSPSTASVPASRTPTTRTPSITPSSSQVRKQPSTTSLRSTTSAKSSSRPSSRPPSAASSSAAPSRNRTTSTTSLIAPRRNSNASTKASIVQSGSTTSLRARTRSKPIPAVPPLPSSSSGTIRARPKPKPKPPGTSLLSGIPCIVTVKGTRPIRMRAMVRYLGSLTGETGQWVGVEVPEDTIPAEAKKLSWNEGKRGEVEYFTLTPPSIPPSTAASSAPSTSSSTPVPSNPPTRPPVARGDSLQPPLAGRQPRRRSSSAEPSPPTGPTKGLFVRPNQIVYVL